MAARTLAAGDRVTDAVGPGLAELRRGVLDPVVASVLPADELDSSASPRATLFDALEAAC